MIDRWREGWKLFSLALLMALGTRGDAEAAGQTRAAARTAAVARPVADAGSALQAPSPASPESAPKRNEQNLRRIVREGRAAGGEPGQAIGRDPFKPPEPPVRRQAEDFPVTGPLPPGVRGLIIHTLRLEGTVRKHATRTMIAVVTNATNIAYFLHENQEVYDGRVDRITENAVYFKQKYYDAEGALRFRDVVLRLGSGEAR